MDVVLRLLEPTELFRSLIFYPRNLICFRINSSKKDSLSTSHGLQKSSKKTLSRILRTEAAIKAIERKANSTKYNNLQPKVVLEALSDAIKENRWESALKIFGLLRNQHWYDAKCQTYTKLLVMLGKCGQPNQANLLFELLHADGLQPTIDVYTALVGVYGFNGLFEDAFRTLDDMKSVSDCTPDVYTYTILIKCCVKHNRLDLIEHILGEMSYFGIECNTVTYNTIVDGYGKARLFDKMEGLLTDMIENGTCLPDVFTFNSVVAAYGNSRQIEKMQIWFDEFQLMGIKPDIVTFNILIKSYGKAGKYDKMGSVLDFMKKRFYSPTIVTYNTIIETFGKAGIFDKMEEIFWKMKHQGMKPNSRTYCSLVSAYGRTGMLNKVESIMRQVENSDVVLDTPFFNCAISAYGRAGDVRRMDDLLHEMKKWNCKPDDVTLSTVIQVYRALGMTEAAEDLDHKVFSIKDSSETKLLER